MRATITAFAGMVLCLALSTVVAGNILPNAGGVLAMGCVDTEDALGPTSQGLGCAGPDGEEYAYWQPIGAASGGVQVGGAALGYLIHASDLSR